MYRPEQYGRNGDTQLVHMRPDEVQGLGLLASALGTDLTINPETGYPEAWKLPKWVLPVAAIAATALTAGAAAPAAAGALGASGAAAGAGAAGAAGAGALGAGAGLGTAAGGTALGTSGVIGSGMGTSGLLAAGEGASMAGGSAFGTALGNATAGTSSGLLGASGAGAGALGAEQAAAPIINQNTAAGMFDKANYASDGLLGNAVNAYDKYGSAVGKVANAAQSAMPEPQQPVQAQPLQNAPLDLSGVLSQANEQKLYDEQENMRRRQMMQQYVSEIRGY